LAALEVPMPALAREFKDSLHPQLRGASFL
jgi:hypothetical protein